MADDAEGSFVTDLAWSGDGSLLATADLDGNVRTVAAGAASGRVVGHHAGGALAVAWSGDTLASGGVDGVVQINPPHGASVTIAHGSWTSPIEWSERGVLAVATGTGVALHRPSGDLLTVHPLLPSSVQAMAWLEGPSGSHLALTTTAGLHLIDQAEPASLRTIDLGASGAGLASAVDGRRLAVGDLAGSVHLYCADTGDSTSLSGHRSPMRLLAWSALADLVLAVGDDQLTVWPVEDIEAVADEPAGLCGHSAPIEHLAVHPWHPLAATADDGGHVVVWDLERQAEQARHRLPAAVTAMAWSPDGTCLTAGLASGNLASLPPT